MKLGFGTAGSRVMDRRVGRPIARDWRQNGVRIAMVLLVLLAIFLALTIAFASRTPMAVSLMKLQIETIPMVDQTARAESFERRITSAVNAPFPGETSVFEDSGSSGNGVSRVLGDDGSVKIGVDLIELNLWLQHRLEPWLNNQGIEVPEGLNGTVTASDGILRLSLDGGLFGARVVTLGLIPEINEGGTFTLSLVDARIGRMPVPASVVQQKMAALDEHLASLLTADGLPAIIPVDARRARRATAVEIMTTQVWITLVAEER